MLKLSVVLTDPTLRTLISSYIILTKLNIKQYTLEMVLKSGPTLPSKWNCLFNGVTNRLQNYNTNDVFIMEFIDKTFK